MKLSDGYTAFATVESLCCPDGPSGWEPRSYGDPRARIAIPVSVADDADIELVTDTLIDVARGVDNVLQEPPAQVQFLKFSEYSLDFRLLVWTNQPRRHVQMRSDINYRIAQLFRERSIKLSTPTQER